MARPIARWYVSFEQGDGIATFTSGRPASAACTSSRVSRTACIATRSCVRLTVVSSATTSTSSELRIACSDQALSLPLLQASQAFGRDDADEFPIAPNDTGDTFRG